MRNAAKFIFNQEVFSEDACGCAANVKAGEKFRSHKYWMDASNVANSHYLYSGSLTTPGRKN